MNTFIHRQKTISDFLLSKTGYEIPNRAREGLDSVPNFIRKYSNDLNCEQAFRGASYMEMQYFFPSITHFNIARLCIRSNIFVGQRAAQQKPCYFLVAFFVNRKKSHPYSDKFKFCDQSVPNHWSKK